jgi:hypothetical protein
MTESITAAPVDPTGQTTCTSITPDQAAGFLGDLGFLVVPGAPGRESTAYLLVAMRKRPTLAHYDPESVLYWTYHGLHDTPACLDQTVPVPFEQPFSWGTLRITDRLGIANEYLTFGGQVRTEQVGDTRIAVFATPAPMIRRGGHSQGWDPGSAHLAAYFARLRAHLGRDRELDIRVTRMTPVARYAGYLAGALNGFAEAPALSADRHAELHHMRTEADRLHHDHPDDWATGLRLLEALGSD